MRISRIGAALTALLASAASQADAAPTATTLYAFTGGIDGGNPSGLAADANGTLFVTLNLDEGGVARLEHTWPGQIQWLERVLYRFRSVPDGAGPKAAPLLGPDNALYATTYNGGTDGLGAIVKLAPPAKPAGAWSEAVIYSFPRGASGIGPAGGAPLAGLAMDGAGNLYTTASAGGTVGGGTVIRLSPPMAAGGAWSPQVIHDFLGGTTDGAGPETAPVLDAAGNVYVTTIAGGTHQQGAIAMFSPPAAGSANWTETILHSFTGADGDFPLSDPVLDSVGNLYVTTFQGGAFNEGTLLRLSPPRLGHTRWPAKVLYDFGQTGLNDGTEAGALLIDGAGRIFVTAVQGGATGNGALLSLSPSRNGTGAWTETMLYSFPGRPGGGNPRGPFLADSNGNLYVSTYEGGNETFFGTLTKLSNAGFKPRH